MKPGMEWSIRLGFPSIKGEDRLHKGTMFYLYLKFKALSLITSQILKRLRIVNKKMRIKQVIYISLLLFFFSLLSRKKEYVAVPKQKVGDRSDLSLNLRLY